MTPARHCLEVWGDLACFTRPELKVERFSYPVITPSAARGILDAIYWKPKFRWRVRQIDIMSPPRYIALRRNEVKEVAPPASTILAWAAGAEPAPILADADKDASGSAERGRSQRQTMALKGVRYRLHAEIAPFPEFRSELPAMEAQFRRRAAAGQCAWQPCLGCREFPAYFRLNDEPVEQPYAMNQHIGWMLYDVYDLSRPGSPDDLPFISAFQASVVDGVLMVPEFESPEVRKPERGGSHA